MPELGVSVLEVPPANVKGRKSSRLVLCNSLAQSLGEAARGQHKDYVFVYRRERVKNLSQAPQMPYRCIGTMSNTAWQRAQGSRPRRPARARARSAAHGRHAAAGSGGAGEHPY